MGDSKYRPEIDGLRALAVFAVILNHFSKNLLPGGYLGVDIFFVISGFVITSSLSGYTSQSIGEFLATFYSRRIKRLIPALVVFVAFSSIAICLFNPHPDDSLRVGFASLFGLANLELLRQSADYFADSSELNIFTHTWSLGVEEQFYVLFPCLFWLSGFGRAGDKGYRNLCATTILLSLLSVSDFVFRTIAGSSAAYFMMPSRFWELGAGCLTYLLYARLPGEPRLLKRIPSTLAGGILVGLLFSTHKVYSTLGVVVATATMILVMRRCSGAYRIFASRLIVYLGRMSYSLYLWHWVVLCLSRWTVGMHWFLIPFQAGLIISLAIISFKTIEEPFRKATWSSGRWPIFAFGLGAATVVAVALLCVMKFPGVSMYTGHKAEIKGLGIRSMLQPYTIQNTDFTWHGRDCVLRSDTDVGKNIPLGNCTLGNLKDAKRRILVIGNSFSATFTQAFDSLVVADSFAVTITSCWGASPVEGVPNLGDYQAANAYYWNTLIPSLTTTLRAGDWVFLISDINEYSPKEWTSHSERHLLELESSLRRFSAKLGESGIRLAMLKGLPFAREANCKPVIAAEQWFTPFGGRCPIPEKIESIRRLKPLSTVLGRLEQEKKLQGIDIFDVFCPGARCTYNAANGEVLYRDEYSHPSIEAARLSSSYFRKAFK